MELTGLLCVWVVGGCGPVLLPVALVKVPPTGERYENDRPYGGLATSPQGKGDISLWDSHLAEGLGRLVGGVGMSSRAVD